MPTAAAPAQGIVVVLIANIAQGLPATVTSALTLTAERMKKVSVCPLLQSCTCAAVQRTFGHVGGLSSERNDCIALLAHAVCSAACGLAPLLRTPRTRTLQQQACIQLSHPSISRPQCSPP